MIIICKFCSKANLVTRSRQFCNQSCNAQYQNLERGYVHKGSKCNDCEKPVTHFSSKRCIPCDSEHKHSIRFLKVLDGTASSQVCKTYFLKTRGHRCEQCLNKEWNGLPIPLELDHTDGNSENNDLNNLKLLCCNCHAQTSTYKGRNKGSGRHYRRVRYAEGKSF